MPDVSKPLLLGMNNPLSDDPEFDLYPYPERSTGWRLWKMLPDGTTRQQYLDAFERLNLVRAREWNTKAAKAAARDVLPMLQDRVVVVLGSDVRSALGLHKAEPLSYHRERRISGTSFAWIALPHPSGRNHWFNKPENYTAACHILGLVMRGELEKIRAVP